MARRSPLPDVPARATHPRLRHVTGTPIYMAPEILQGRPYDTGADVWAFGVTLWEAMALTAPWSQLDDGHGGLEGGMVGLLY